MAAPHDLADMLDLLGRAVCGRVGVPGDVLKPPNRIVAEAVVVNRRRRERRVQRQQHRLAK